MTAAVRRIGRYAVEGVVGAGAFATVYRAVDERLGTTVAIKVLADNHCLDPDIRARFIDEGRALRRIDSAHVVRVYDAGETDQTQPYLVLDFADHGTLAQRVAERRAAGWRPTAADVRLVVTELAEAMQALHAADLVHRDLSPGNVLLRTAPVRPATGSTLVDDDEHLVVADLGLSKDLARSSGLTVASGTDGFRPPEQQGGPALISPRADLWALSALVFWLLAGEPPAASDPRANRRALDNALAGAALSPDVTAPLLVSLEEDPARRHADVATWCAAMTDALAAPPPTDAETQASEPWHHRPVVRRLALVAAGLALGVAGVVVLSSLGGGDPWSTRQLDGGQASVTASAGDAQLTLVGPEEAPVGTTVSFEANAEGVDRWVWLMPDGQIYLDSPTAEVRTQSPGVARITLLGTTDSGERLEVVHELRVSDGEG